MLQLPCIEGHRQANLDTMCTAWQNTPRETDIVVFPELMLTGFAEAGHTDSRAITLDAPELQVLANMSRSRHQAAAVGFLLQDGGKVYNATAWITPEDGVGCLYRKTHLWDEEQHLIAAGKEFVCTTWRGVRFGLITCFDIEFPESARYTAALGCDVLLVCDGNMDPYVPVHTLAAQTRAMENQIFVCLANRVGSGMGLHFSGNSLACAPDGTVLAKADDTEGALTVKLDLQQLHQARQSYDYLKQKRSSYLGEHIRHAKYDTWSMQ